MGQFLNIPTHTKKLWVINLNQVLDVQVHQSGAGELWLVGEREPAPLTPAQAALVAEALGYPLPPATAQIVSDAGESPTPSAERILRAAGLTAVFLALVWGLPGCCGPGWQLSYSPGGSVTRVCQIEESPCPPATTAPAVTPPPALPLYTEPPAAPAPPTVPSGYSTHVEGALAEGWRSSLVQ